jgi:bacillithiol system protein YtxJ
MFGELLAKWKRGGSGGAEASKPEFRTAGDVQKLLSEDLAIVFKHSTACPVSWSAHTQVTRFMKAHPEAPVYMVPVIKDRPLSQKIAAATGVRHESPQIIVLRKGKVVASASHGEITVDELTEMSAV